MNGFEDVELNLNRSKLLNMVGYCESSDEGTIWETSDEAEIEAGRYLLEKDLLKEPQYASGVDSEGNRVGQYQLSERGRAFIKCSKAQYDGWVGGMMMEYDL